MVPLFPTSRTAAPSMMGSVVCRGTRVTSSEELGSVTGASDAAESRFYSGRYEYRQGWRGGYLDRPDRDQTLEALFSDRVVVFDGHGAEAVIGNQMGDEATTAASIRALHDQYGFTSAAKFVLLECCLSALNTPASVANALEYVGVDCIIGWTINCPGSDPGYFELLDLMCNQGKSAYRAYLQVCMDHLDTWGPENTRIIGNAELWGEPL